MGMSTGLSLETNMKGGIMGAAKRALGGESLFLNTYTATEDNQRLDIAPSAPGDLKHIEMVGKDVMVQSGSYCCCTPEVSLDTKWGGAKSFFGGEGLFLLKASGQGDLYVSSYGAIHPLEVKGSYIVDTSHIVAFDATLQYNVRKVGGLKSLFFSGEGLVVEFSGTGRLWIQTRAVPALASFLHPFRAVQSNN